MTAREPSQAPIFNYASMAHNTHFFFQTISPTGSSIPDALRKDLETSFSSIETLKREFVVTASAMFGPGFVWLVRAGPTDYRILTTYLAGSPYPGAHWRQQGSDMNTLGQNNTARDYLSSQINARRKQQAGGAGDLAPGGIQLEPLLCLSTWEHSWLLDWGVGREGHGGKAAFVESWWETIDWELVSGRTNFKTPDYLRSGLAE
jgi:superoxide dismutase, Fe-Mn family